MQILHQHQEDGGIQRSNTVNPDRFIAENDDVEVKVLLGGLQCASVEYEQWKRVEDQDFKKRMKIVKTEVEKEEFNNIIENNVSEFRIAPMPLLT